MLDILKRHAKLVAAGVGLAVLLTGPAYFPEAKGAVEIVVSLLTALGVYAVPNKTGP